MKLKKAKKGFTLVELVVVIAIIAVLSTVSVVGYFGFTKKANVSGDKALVSQLNTILKAKETETGSKPETATEAIGYVEEQGINVAKLKPLTSKYLIAWNSEANEFALLNESKELVTGKLSSTANLNWLIASSYSVTENTGYSVYLMPDYKGDSTLNITTGLDVGENTNVDVVNYTNESSTAKSVVIRTNGGELNINAENDTIYHHGNSDDVNIIKCADHSYYLYGEVTGAVTVKQGHVKITEGATVNTIVVPLDITGTIEVENKGTVSVVNTENASTENISIKNEGTIDIAVGQITITGNKSENSYTESKKLTSDTHEITAGGYYDGTGVTFSTVENFGDVGSYSLFINTTEKVIINGFQYNGNGQGILVSKPNEESKDLTLVNSFIKGTRAICVKGADRVTIDNCDFSYFGLSDFDEEVANGNPGFLINNSGACITLKNSEIKGYAYSVYTSIASDVKIDILNCILKGRAGLATYETNGLVATINGCKIHGVNGFTGSTEVYANITTQNIDDNNKNITLNIANCDFTVYRLPATVNNFQYAISVDFENTNLNLTGNNTFYGTICYSENLTKSELSNKAYDIIKDVRTDTTKGNEGFASVEMLIKSSNGNNCFVKIK